jgi:hypothetical protein
MVPSNRIPVSKRPPGVAPTSVIDQAQKLRDLASWYRQFAERAGSSAIWDARLRTAEKLEEEANSLEHLCESRLAREERRT